MPELNALIEASREVTRAANALYWGRYLTDELRAEASARLEAALNGLVRVACDGTGTTLRNQQENPSWTPSSPAS